MLFGQNMPCGSCEAVFLFRLIFVFCISFGKTKNAVLRLLRGGGVRRDMKVEDVKSIKNEKTEGNL